MKFIRNIRTNRVHAYDKSLLELPDYVEHDEDPQLTPTESKQIRIYLSAYGIGDAVVGYYAACGIADQGYEVEFQTKHHEWLARVSHPGVTLAKEDGRPDFDANIQYKAQHKAALSGECASRADWYIQNLRRKYTFPECRPARPKAIRKAANRPVSGRYVVFAPVAAWPTRCWPVAHWNRLARLFHKAGYTIVGIGGPHDKQTMAKIDLDVRLVGTHPSQVLDAIQGAALLVGNDSGMTHIAGLYNVKAVSVLGPTTRDFTFECSPSVMGATSNASCAGCYWQESKGFQENCEHGCSAILLVSPEQVFALATGDTNENDAPQENGPPRRVRRKPARNGDLRSGGEPAATVSTATEEASNGRPGGDERRDSDSTVQTDGGDA